ncbi:hypothetical protein KI387_000958, partial [Taxus chinensis]
EENVDDEAATHDSASPRKEASIFQFEGCIQRKKVIVSINTSKKYKFINMDVTQNLHVQTKHIKESQMD